MSELKFCELCHNLIRENGYCSWKKCPNGAKKVGRRTVPNSDFVRNKKTGAVVDMETGVELYPKGAKQ